MSHWVFILCTSFLLWARSCLGMGPSSFSSAPVSLYFWFVGRLVFLQCHFITSTMLPLDLCLLDLFWACHDFFLIQFTLPSVSAGLILIPSWASLAHFIFFGHPQPALFFRASSAHFISLSILGPFHSYILMGFCYIFWASPTQLPYHLLSGFIGLCTNPVN